MERRASTVSACSSVASATSSTLAPAVVCGAPTPAGLGGGWEHPLTRDESKHRVLCLYQVEVAEADRVSKERDLLLEECEKLEERLKQNELEASRAKRRVSRLFEVRLQHLEDADAADHDIAAEAKMLDIQSLCLHSRDDYAQRFYIGDCTGATSVTPETNQRPVKTLRQSSSVGLLVTKIFLIVSCAGVVIKALFTLGRNSDVRGVSDLAFTLTTCQLDEIAASQVVDNQHLAESTLVAPDAFSTGDLLTTAVADEQILLKPVRNTTIDAFSLEGVWTTAIADEQILFKPGENTTVVQSSSNDFRESGVPTSRLFGQEAYRRRSTKRLEQLSQSCRRCIVGAQADKQKLTASISSEDEHLANTASREDDGHSADPTSTHIMSEYLANKASRENGPANGVANRRAERVAVTPQSKRDSQKVLELRAARAKREGQRESAKVKELRSARASRERLALRYGRDEEDEQWQ